MPASGNDTNWHAPFPFRSDALYSSQDALSSVGRLRKGKAMNVSFIQPEQHLSPYVALIWIFESRFGVPLADSRLIVPDGRAKIIVPYRNSLCAAVNTHLLSAKEHHIFLVGIQTHPTTIASTATDTDPKGTLPLVQAEHA